MNVTVVEPCAPDNILTREESLLSLFGLNRASVFGDMMERFSGCLYGNISERPVWRFTVFFLSFCIGYKA